MKAAPGKAWSSRSLGSRFKHEFFYLTIRYAGRRTAGLFLWVVVFFYSLNPMVLRRSAPYLSRRFPNDSRWGRWHRAFQLNLSFGRVLLDRAIMGISGSMTFQAPAEEAAKLNQLLARGKGLLILSAHVGAWQTGMGWLAADRKVYIVQRRDPEDVDRQYFEHQNAPGAKALRPEFIDPEQSGPALMATLSSALLGGHIVCLMGDRVLNNEPLKVRTSFLGGDIYLPAAPYFLAARLACPIAVVFTERCGPMTVKGRVYKVLEPKQALKSEAALRPWAGEFAEALEEYVHNKPYQFFNFYDLWNI